MWGEEAIFSGSKNLLITTFSCITLFKILKFTVINLIYPLFETQGRPRCCARPARWQFVTKRIIRLVSSQFTIQGLQTACLGCGCVPKEGSVIAWFQSFVCSDWVLCRSKSGNLETLRELRFSSASPQEWQPEQDTGDTRGTDYSRSQTWSFQKKKVVSGNIMDPTWRAE